MSYDIILHFYYFFAISLIITITTLLRHFRHYFANIAKILTGAHYYCHYVAIFIVTIISHTLSLLFLHYTPLRLLPLTIRTLLFIIFIITIFFIAIIAPFHFIIFILLRHISRRNNHIPYYVYNIFQMSVACCLRIFRCHCLFFITLAHYDGYYVIIGYLLLPPHYY